MTYRYLMNLAIVSTGEVFEGSRKLRITCRDEGVSSWGFRSERYLGPSVSKTSYGHGGNTSAHHTSKLVAFGVALHDDFLSLTIFRSLYASCRPRAAILSRYLLRFHTRHGGSGKL